MGRMNWARIAAGGLLTGVVIAVLGSVATALTRPSWEAAMTALGSEFSDPTMTWPASSIAFGTAIQLSMGIVAVWTYAALRPRFGPGPTTAALAGFVVWLIGAAQTLSLVVLRVMAFEHFVVLAGPHVVAWVLGTMVGARFYQDRPSESALGG